MKGRISRDRYLSDAELEAFMRAVRERRHVNQPRDHAFFALLANTGIRPSEAIGLTRATIHLTAARPWIRVWRLKKSKPAFDDLEITEGLKDLLAARLMAIPEGEDSRPFPLHRRTAARLFHYYARKAGILRKTRLYILRHTAATRLYRATRDIRLVQALLGHESPDTTAIYAHVPAEILRAAASTPAIV